MANDLHGLIRLHRWQMDERRKNLTDLQGQIDRIEQDLADLDAQERLEREIADQQTLPPPNFGRFLEGLRLKREGMHQKRRHLERQADVIRDQIADSFREVKKFELTQEARDLARTREAAKRENDAFDEVAHSRHARRTRGR